ncbi:heme exporter protein CcmD [Aggregatibacter actinomycetemcomitans]|uniref:Heme exporter protein D n=1 Tax=Aggregatibacter actinomycetemcomitans TaxID=714 RepID=A0A142FYW9_AGGAC|nr:heme exporter protein CcmD [Aggregatibacter actinomycetemcomitans]AFI87659.2 hemagglutination activity protein [Aggregatibacter actinomycetemcomitans D7S-1]KYK97102.1 hemagglutination activity protein [Aggregatibacter actinomycetemcomitans serotype d str. SA3733]AMQ93599.1 hemagglutination activity protein [Aggregatibacter actinomycetemcomitans]ANU81179.1 heme exporter protein CcmD [Aggregatibacter actinomycetemcomitans]KND83711.1 hemagglutination activity protein [Aggregatibacter actinomyc
MFFQSWNEFINMGGYGFYVWLSYGLSLLVIGVLIVQSLAGKSAVLKSIKREQQRETRLQQLKQKGEAL